MHLVVNGLRREAPEGITLEGLLDLEGEPVRHVVVEVNGAFIAKGEYPSRVLSEGDRIEIILPAFGG